MTLNGVMAVTLRYFTEFGKNAFQCGKLVFRHNNRVDLWRNICTSLLYCTRVRRRHRRKESSRSLSYLLMSFLFANVNSRSPGFTFAVCHRPSVCLSFNHSTERFPWDDLRKIYLYIIGNSIRAFDWYRPR